VRDQESENQTGAGPNRNPALADSGCKIAPPHIPATRTVASTTTFTPRIQHSGATMTVTRHTRRMRVDDTITQQAHLDLIQVAQRIPDVQWPVLVWRRRGGR
jgi:hypothetical protein